MRSYSKMSPAFWIKGSGRELRGDMPAQLLALYLMNCPATNMSGVFYLPSMTMAHETGMSIEQVDRALSRLAEPNIAIAYYDAERELVWLPACAHWQVGPTMKAGDTKRVPVLAELDRVGKHPFVRAFWDRYEGPYLLPERHDLPPWRPNAAPDRVSSGVAFLGHPDGVSGTPHMGNRSEQNRTEQEQRGTLSGDTPSSISKPEPAKPKKSRAAKSLIPVDWQARPEDLKPLIDANLSPESVVGSFRDYWTGEGKMMADWNATFRNEVRKVLSTQWLRERHLAPPKPLRIVPKPTDYGPPGAVPEELLRPRPGGLFGPLNPSPLFDADPATDVRPKGGR